MKIHYKKDLFKGYSGLCESVFCAPFESSEKFKEEEFENNRFLDLINNGKNYIEFSEIEKCDYVVIPYKWDNYSQNTINIINEAKKYGKKVISLHNDDFLPSVTLSDQDGFLFTTTLYKNQRKKNEFSFPAFTGDFFDDKMKYNLNRIISFCGGITHQIRHFILSKIMDCNEIEKCFVIRDGFWAPGLTKIEARKEFINNIKDNTFVLCMRGAGNFSYRFYETIMMGRIPIIIDTDQVFPFENIINYDEFSIRISLSEIDNISNILISKISDFSDNEIIKMQEKSRQIWLEYMSPQGWIKNFELELKNKI